MSYHWENRWTKRESLTNILRKKKRQICKILHTKTNGSNRWTITPRIKKRHNSDSSRVPKLYS